MVHTENPSMHGVWFKSILGGGRPNRISDLWVQQNLYLGARPLCIPKGEVKVGKMGEWSTRQDWGMANETVMDCFYSNNWT